MSLENLLLRKLVISSSMVHLYMFTDEESYTKRSGTGILAGDNTLQKRLPYFDDDTIISSYSHINDRMWLRQWRHVQRNERHCSHAPAAQRPSHHSTSQKYVTKITSLFKSHKVTARRTLDTHANSFSFRRTWEGLDNKEFFFDTWEVKDGRDKTGGCRRNVGCQRSRCNLSTTPPPHYTALTEAITDEDQVRWFISRQTAAIYIPHFIHHWLQPVDASLCIIFYR
ncbi:hypothetical protein J6590_068117 [Homalodisca vitripennis]|nr:hypothetical protein J6590_068117 [Homalodisca vitripennis]